MFLTKKSSAMPPRAGAIARALCRLREAQAPAPRPVRIGFIIDATGSREAGWQQAQRAQRRIFSAVAGLGAVMLRLQHFGGGELTDHGWRDDSMELAAAMAAVRCRTGLTQILPALQSFIGEDKPAAAVILVGDSFEENPDPIAGMLPFLRAGGTRIFAFFEGNDAHAEAVFRRMAEGTNGRFARLSTDLPLVDLCEGVALLAAGGRRAIKQLKNERARRLLLAAPAPRKE